MEYSFNKEHAKKYGVSEAIVIKNLQFWISKNMANNYSCHDGRTWTYNTISAFQELFDFWSVSQIKRILKSLIDQDIIMVGNYNKIKYDRTKWYAFVDEKAFLSNNQTIRAKQQMEKTKSSNGKAEVEQAIPNNKTTDTNTNTKNIYYKDMVAIYDSFCLEFLDVPARINGVEGKALKEIIKYLINIAKKKGVEENTCLDSFSYIFNHWGMLDDFTRKQVKLSQINSNLPNIINQIKNGKQTQSKSLAQDIIAKYQ